ncbi:MAG TPA: hypothetical protein VLY04_16770 [Bryobacteraceae bacterium]|nr:hypothetical protein [Bryobacteraceae bacterium]
MRTLVLSAAIAALCLPAYPAGNQDDVNVPEIIKKFAAKEAEFREARNNYTYRQSVKMEELDAGGNPSGGKWEEVDDIIFTPEGKRMEKVVYAPVISLKNIGLTPEDVQDLRDVQPFVLTTDEVGEYNVNYLGRDKLDEISCFEFSVKPKKMVKGKRYFEGEVWVDDRDLQIVKTYGKGVGLVDVKRNQFPKFETYREQIDGKYWFPTYTHADDTLHFQDFSQRIKMTVKYQDYKRYEGRSTIRYGGVVDDTKSTAPPPTKKK